jgi:hypothetical protein
MQGRLMLAGLSTRVRDSLAGVEDWVGGVTVLEWVLLALAFGAILWVVLAARAATTLGPIHVDKIECDGTPAPPLLAMTARLRQGINEVGLRPPPDVPAGAPQANLLSAIEASPIPNANWIASLLKLVPYPEPVGYRLTTTVASQSGDGAFWLRPLNPGGDPLLETVDELEDVPKRILMHVTKDARHMFPAWSQWTKPSALQDYLDGLEGTRLGHHSRARDYFSRAGKLDPGNAIVQLRLLNMQESVAITAHSRATVLRGYLDFVARRPELVEARYRAASLAAALADTYEGTEDDRAAIGQALGVTPTPDLPDDLRKLHRLGLAQARRQLRWWFVPLVWRRPRYAAEPQAEKRRSLLRVLRVSGRCGSLRRHPLWRRNLGWSQRWRWSATRRGWLTLRVRLIADHPGEHWHVYYNAGCFFALLDGGEREAFRFLNRALDSGAPDNLKAWIQKDPDLERLRRDHDAEWRAMIARRPTGRVADPGSFLGEIRSLALLPLVALAAAAALVGLVAFPLAIVVPVVGFLGYVVLTVGRYVYDEKRLTEPLAGSG